MTAIFLSLNYLTTFMFAWMIPEAIFWFTLGMLVAFDIVGIFIIFNSVWVSIPDAK